MIRRGSSDSRAGFTLVEVMIALSILFAALVVLLRGAAMNIAATQRAHMLTAATELARSKMYDIEETLLDEGFQELDQTLEGKFDEEGWPNITWEAEIVKIELPNIAAMQGMGGEGEGEEGGEAAADSAAASPLGGLLGMAGGLGGEDGGVGAGFIQSQFEIFRSILEESIRKVTLTVRWRGGGEEDELVVDCYFTDPEAITRVIALGPGGGGEEGEDGEEDGGGGRGGSVGGGNDSGGRRGDDSGRGGGGRGGRGGRR